MAIAKKIFRRIGIKTLIKKGYSPYMAIVAMHELEEDLFENEGLSLKQKLDSYRKGYYSERIKSYNLKNDQQYDAYIPEIKYYKLHPINGFYSRWIDDKLTMRHLLNPFAQYLPEYYFHMTDSKVMKLCDCPNQYGNTLADVLQLIKDKGEVAAKQLFGSKGDGFYKLSFKNQQYYVNNQEVKESKFIETLSSLKNYLITNYIITHKKLLEIFPQSTNSVRVMLINDDQGPIVAGAFIRFGTEKSGVVDNISAGGIFCGVDIETGHLFKPYQYDAHKNVIDAIVHPNTGVKIEGNIESWDLIKSKLIEIGEYLPQLKYMGFDVVVTDDGFKIIEINSHQGLQHMQLFYPMMKNPTTRAFFTKLLADKK